VHSFVIGEGSVNGADDANTSKLFLIMMYSICMCSVHCKTLKWSMLMRSADAAGCMGPIDVDCSNVVIVYNPYSVGMPDNAQRLDLIFFGLHALFCTACVILHCMIS